MGSQGLAVAQGGAAGVEAVRAQGLPAAGFVQGAGGGVGGRDLQGDGVGGPGQVFQGGVQQQASPAAALEGGGDGEVGQVGGAVGAGGQVGEGVAARGMAGGMQEQEQAGGVPERAVGAGAGLWVGCGAVAVGEGGGPQVGAGGVVGGGARGDGVGDGGAFRV